MWNQLRIVGGAVMMLSLALAGSVANSQDKKPSPPPEFLPRPESLYSSLRDVINLGARLFNEQGDQAGCYRVYQGGLIAARPYLVENPALLKQVDDALNNAEKMQKVNEKAFALRTVIDVVRTALRPTTAVKRRPVEAVPAPNPETKKKLDNPNSPPSPGFKEPLKTDPPPVPKLDPKQDLSNARPGPKAPGKAVVVSINANNQLFVNNEPIALDQLPARMRPMLKKDGKQEFVLRADRDLPYGRVVQVKVEMVRAGANNIREVYDVGPID